MEVDVGSDDYFSLEEGGPSSSFTWRERWYQRCCGAKRPMTVRERMFLTPIEKWVHYGRVPAKLLLTVALVVLTTLQIVAFSAQEAGVYAAAEQFFSFALMPEGFDFSDGQWPLFTKNATMAAIQRATTSFYSFNEFALDEIVYECLQHSRSSGNVASGAVRDACTDPKRAKPPILTVSRYAKVDLYSTPSSALKRISAKHKLGPDASPVLEQLGKEAWNALIALDWDAQVLTIPPGGLFRACLFWDLHLRLDLSSRATVYATVTATPSTPCPALPKGSPLHDPPALFVVLNLVVLALVVWLIALQARAIARNVRLVARVRRWAERLRDPNRQTREPALSGVSVRSVGAPADATHWEGPQEGIARSESVMQATETVVQLPAWEQLSLWERLRVVNPWYVFGAVAAGLAGVSAIVLLAHGSVFPPSPSAAAILQGLSCALLWVSLIRFLEHDRHFFSIILTLRHAMPRVLRFLLGVLPIFIAYALFAVAVFAPRIPRFKTFGASAVTLFAMANGDVLRETYVAMQDDFPVLTPLFWYSFIALFIYVVLNCTIAIVEESFFSTAQQSEELLALQRRLTQALPSHPTAMPSGLERLTEVDGEDDGSSQGSDLREGEEDEGDDDEVVEMLGMARRGTISSQDLATLLSLNRAGARKPSAASSEKTSSDRGEGVGAGVAEKSRGDGKHAHETGAGSEGGRSGGSGRSGGGSGRSGRSGGDVVAAAAAAASSSSSSAISTPHSPPLSPSMGGSKPFSSSITQSSSMRRSGSQRVRKSVPKTPDLHALELRQKLSSRAKKGEVGGAVSMDELFAAAEIAHIPATKKAEEAMKRETEKSEKGEKKKKERRRRKGAGEEEPVQGEGEGERGDKW